MNKHLYFIWLCVIFRRIGVFGGWRFEINFFFFIVLWGPVLIVVGVSRVSYEYTYSVCYPCRCVRARVYITLHCSQCMDVKLIPIHGTKWSCLYTVFLPLHSMLVLSAIAWHRIGPIWYETNNKYGDSIYYSTSFDLHIYCVISKIYM